MRECRGMGCRWIFGFLWLLFKKEMKHEKTIRKECCSVNLKDVIVYVLLYGRYALCGRTRSDWAGLGRGRSVLLCGSRDLEPQSRLTLSGTRVD